MIREGKKVKKYSIFYGQKKVRYQISQHWFLNKNPKNSKTLFSLPNTCLLGNYLLLQHSMWYMEKLPPITYHFQHSVLLKIKWPPRYDNKILGVLKVIILRRCRLKYLEVK